MERSFEAATSLVLELRHLGSQPKPPILLDRAVLVVSAGVEVAGVAEDDKVAAALTVVIVMEVLGVMREGADCVEGRD